MTWKLDSRSLHTFYLQSLYVKYAPNLDEWREDMLWTHDRLNALGGSAKQVFNKVLVYSFTVNTVQTHKYTFLYACKYLFLYFE